MAEYIEREALISEIQEEIDFETTMYTEEQNKYFNMGLKCALRNIKRQPAADVVEVRRGEWVKDTRTADVCAEYRCSFCGFIYCEAEPKYPPYKYCPECGSKNE